MPHFDPIDDFPSPCSPLPGDEVEPCAGIAKARLLILAIGGILIVAMLIAAVLTTPRPTN